MTDSRSLDALRILDKLVNAAHTVAKYPTEDNIDFLNEVLAEYESGDAYDLVSDELYRPNH